MNTIHIIQSVFELSLLAAVIIGFIFEDKLVNLEQRIFKKWRVKK